MKKKREILIFLIFIINSIYVLADEEVYNKWHYTGDNFTAAGKTFTIHSVTETQTKIEFDGKILNINNASCDVSDFIKTCIVEIKKDEDISLGYKSNIKIYKMIAELELTRTIDKTSFIIGETANVEISIKNTGSREATDINFEDKFPDEIKVKNANGCFIKDHTAFWQDSLWQDQEKKCSYKIEALGKVDYESKAELGYYNGYQTITLSSTKKKITVGDYALKIETSLDRNDIGEEFNFNIKLKNTNKDYSLHVPYINFKIPKEIGIIEKPLDLWQDDNVITFKGEIEPDSTNEYSLRLKSEKTGTYKLKEEVRFLINKIVNEFEKEEDIVIEIREPRITHNIKDSYLSNEEINFNLKIYNPSKKYRFNDLTIKIKGIINASYNTQKIDENTEIIAFDKNIKLPKVEEDEIMQFNVTFEYKTIYRQPLSSTISKDVLIKAPEVVIEDVTEVNITEVKEEEKIEKEEEKPKEEVKKEKKERKKIEINLAEISIWIIVFIFIIIFLLIDYFLVISIIKKMKK